MLTYSGEHFCNIYKYIKSLYYIPEMNMMHIHLYLIKKKLTLNTKVIALHS